MSVGLCIALTYGHLLFVCRCGRSCWCYSWDTREAWWSMVVSSPWSEAQEQLQKQENLNVLVLWWGGFGRRRLDVCKTFRRFGLVFSDRWQLLFFVFEWHWLHIISMSFNKCLNLGAIGNENVRFLSFIFFLAPSGALIAIPTYYWSTTPLFQITPVLNTGLSLSEPLQLYKGYNAI